MRVEVVNESGQDIKVLRIQHSSLSSNGTIDTGPLAAHQSRTLRYFLFGEGSYKLEVTLNDGRILHGGGGYVEAGYSTRHVISATEIKNPY